MHEDDDKLPPLDNASRPRAPFCAKDEHDRTTLYAHPAQNAPEPARREAPPEAGAAAVPHPTVGATECPPVDNHATLAAPPEPTVSPSPSPPPGHPTAPARAALQPRWAQDLSPPPQRKRTIPRRLKIAGLAALVLLSIVASRSCLGRHDPPPKPARVVDAPIVNAEDLKDRTEVSADDFRPKRNYARPTAPRDTAPPIITEEMLRQRQARRAEDPSEVAAVHRQRPRAPAEPQPEPAPPPTPAPRYRRATMHLQPEPATRFDDRVAELRRPAAGDSVAAVTQGTAQISGSTTIIAVVDRPGLLLPEGTRFIGVASLDGHLVSVRFRKLVLPDSREAHIHAEAQTEDGSFGLPIDVPDDRGETSVEDDVARDAADELVGTVLGDNLLTRTARSYDRHSRQRRRSGSSRPSLVLPAGTPCRVFFHEAPRVE